MTIGAKPTRLIPIEQVIGGWAWKAPSDTTIEHLLDPPTWAHVHMTLKEPGTHITVQPEGLAWEAEFIVLAAGPGFAKVRLIRQDFLNQLGEVPNTLGVRWNGPTHKYIVFRKADGEVLKPGFLTTEDAEEWARKHSMAMAA